MSEKTETVIPIPYFFLGVTMAPIFLIAFVFPASPDSEFYWKLNYILDNYLLGQVGYWSSNFPFSSKAIVNYVNILGPLYAFVFFAKVYPRMVMGTEKYAHHTVFKYFLAVVIFICFLGFIIYVNYFDSVDLGRSVHKWRFFGDNSFTYSIFLSGMLILYQSMTIIIYEGFFNVPRFLIKRWRDNKNM